MLLLAISLAVVAPPTAYFAAPAGAAFAEVVPGGKTILPNGRFLTPKGKRWYTGEDLWGVACSPDGKYVVGFHDGGLTVVTTSSGERRRVDRREVAPNGRFDGEGRLIFSLGDEPKLEILDLEKLTTVATIDCDDPRRKGSYLNDFVLSADGRYAYAVDIAYQELVTVDVKARRVASRVKAGREPYAIARDGRSNALFVANIGLFDYSLIPPRTDTSEGVAPGLLRPAFAFPSKESERGVRREGRSIPGIGSPYVPDAQSIWRYGVQRPSEPGVERKVTSGILIHAPTDAGKAVGGSAPNAVLCDRQTLYVSNANNDTIQMLDARSLRVKRTVKLTPVVQLARLRGVIPSAMAINRAGNRLFVCESGLNSIAVIDTARGNVLGRIPAGWFPTQIALSPDERTLYVAAQKGIGRGPRGALHRRPESDERFGLADMPGMIQAVSLPDEAGLRAGNDLVLQNNGLVPARPPQLEDNHPLPLKVGQPSNQIRYVVFITKENHTFDGIFGGLPGSRSEPAYAEFGLSGWIREQGKTQRVPMMPNHIRLAQQFAISDNFYMEPQASGDGHRWLIGVYPSLWTTRVFYAGWDFQRNDAAKGRLVSFGSYGSQIPEDYLENGSLFEHLHRANISMRNYGEGYELPQGEQGEMTNRAGIHYIVNHPMPKVLYDNTCFEFPAYNTNIPDIARADWFVEDIEKNYRKKGKPFPRFINICLCNDHGDRPRPAKGYPFTGSYMADNDLALGRVVEYLSRQPEWRQMAIFVTQDDPGGDDDSVDRHRSFVMCISPYAKRGYVTHDHTSIMSIIRTIYMIFGAGPNNLFDAVATPLHDMFTSVPDFTPYRHVPVDPRVFRPEATFDPFDPEFKRRRTEAGSVRMDDPDFVESLRTRGGEISKP